jgi:hypothetical protein
MKATEVRILPALDPGESYVEPTFVLVETELAEDGSAVTTVEHLASRVVGDKVRWQVTTLGQSVPLSHAAALEWAVSFAASRDVPIVYHRDGSVDVGYAAASSRTSSASPSSSAPPSSSLSK